MAENFGEIVARLSSDSNEVAFSRFLLPSCAVSKWRNRQLAIEEILHCVRTRASLDGLWRTCLSVEAPEPYPQLPGRTCTQSGLHHARCQKQIEEQRCTDPDSSLRISSLFSGGQGNVPCCRRGLENSCRLCSSSCNTGHLDFAYKSHQFAPRVRTCRSVSHLLVSLL